MELISRIDAKKSGVSTYFTGQSCSRGHIGPRRSANGSCVQCNRDAQSRHRANNLESSRAKSRQWYKNNKDHAKAWKQNWIKENPEEYKARRKKYRSKIDVRAREMLAASKWSAAKKSVPFDLDVEWILEKLQTGACELTGIKFQLEPLDGGLQNPYTASMDRIMPARGYVKSNVRMILWALNAAFHSYGENVYADIARVYLAKNRTGLT